MRFAPFATIVLPLFIAASPTAAQNVRERELNATEQAAQALARLTYGARPGEVERVASMGVDKWIAQQLRPASLSDSVMMAELSPLQSWTADAQSLARISAPLVREIVPMMMSADSGMMQPNPRRLRVRLPLAFTGFANEFVSGQIIRAQLSERQLEEVMAEFWMNHFSVFSGKMPTREAIVVYSRDVIRPRTMGKFRDLLGAVAHSPAMLHYLDNRVSRADSLHRSLTEFRSGATADSRNAGTKRLGLNENYARELLELHTLGVNGGYTQQDVVDVARALTGWATPTRPGTTADEQRLFAFDADMHDAEVKLVLGNALGEGRGVEDGEQVLDIVARHPSTARFIATKLARRFVSDSPPPALIDRAAQTFLRTDGDITEVLRTIFTSPEFFSRSAFRSKVKTPFELVVSVRRAVNAPADTSVASARTIAMLGQPTFGKETPEGWPDVANAWMNYGAMFGRLSFTEDVAAGRLKYLPTAGWDGWQKLESAPLQQQVNGVINSLLGGVADTATRKLMMETATPTTVAIGGTPSGARLRELLVLALSSPEFQRR